MRDYAHEWTDEQIEKLVKRFDKEYSQAAREMRKKLEDALSEYGRENAQRLKALDDTPQAKKAYEDWKMSQAVSQQWMRDMVHQLSESATHANMHAADMINDCLPHVYSENSNMAAFALDKQLGFDTGFTLVNEDAVRYLMGLPLQKVGDDQLLREVTWNPDIERMHVQDLRKREVDYPKDMRWNRERFQSAITQGILQGESIPNIVKRTNDIYGRNKASATRAARTATTNAENAGRMNTFERAQRLGIDMEIEWLATLDGRTRSSHRALDGERIQLGEKFSNGLRWPADPYGPASEIWNCFVGDTKAVPLGGLQRSFRRFYDGDAVTVVTASGVNFTCTPNHPILTSEGWVLAGLLDDSYDLFVADLGNGLDSSGVKPDIKHVGASLEAIHEFVSVPLDNRASSLGVYFHEDVLARNVDVVTEERALRVNQKTLGLEPIDEISLELPDTLASSDGPKMKFVGTPMTPPDSLMSSGSKPRALLGSGIRHALEHGLRTVSGSDSSPLESDIYDTSTDAEVLGESLHALSAVVKLDHVVNVDVHPIATHVYNLQTESGTYLASSSDNIQVYIIAHNCRCRANGRVVGFDGKRGDWADERGQRWTRLPKGMTYDEWKKAKAVSREESYKNPSSVRMGMFGERERNKQRHQIVNGEDILGTWQRRPEQYDFEIDDVLAAQGFDGLPRVVDADEFERAASESNFIAVRGYKAPDEATLEEYRRQLYEGKWYVDCSSGGAVHGQGMYTFSTYGTEPTERMRDGVKTFSGVDGLEHGTVETMTVHPSFKTIEEQDIPKACTDAALARIKNDYGEDVWKVTRWSTGNATPDDSYAEVSQRVYANNAQELTKAMQEYVQAGQLNGLDKGSAAAAMGYDGIHVDVDGNTEYTVVLNRTKLIIRRPE